MNAPSTQKLPDAWVESLLARMLAIYGQKFRAQWADVPPEAMRETWAVALGRFDGERIKWALDQMIAACPWPPTLPEFVSLCRQAPRREPVALPAPTPTEQQRAARAEQMAGGAFAAKPPGKWWAEKLRVRFLSGKALTYQQIEMASDALGEVWAGEGKGRTCAPRYEAEAA